jgi:putative sigma-54 modulation protein
MDVVTTARRFKLTPQMREHAEKRLRKLGRYSENIMEARLVLDQEKRRQIAELTVLANGAELISREQTHDMVSSIDRVVDRIERQLKKLNARQRDRKTRRPIPPSPPVEEEELPETETADEWGPVVVRGHQWEPGETSVEEAIRWLRDKDEDLLLFRNSRTGKVGVVYTRPDGNFGLIEEGD